MLLDDKIFMWEFHEFICLEAEVKIKINESSILFTGEIKLISAGHTRQKH